MLEKSRALLIDVGNTRTKYSVFSDSQELSETKILVRSQNIAFKSSLTTILKTCSMVFIASVVEQETNAIVDRIKQYIVTTDNILQYKVIKVRSQEFGIQCPYKQPEKLGIDRWLTALAVAKRTHIATAIIDAGTAITVDFVHNGKYLGGWISPGLRLLHESLIANTAQIDAATKRLQALQIGDSTEACVNNGCLAAALGIIHGAIVQLERLGSHYQVILLGGDAEYLLATAKMTHQHITIEQDLVFQGMALFVDSAAIQV